MFSVLLQQVDKQESPGFLLSPFSMLASQGEEVRVSVRACTCVGLPVRVMWRPGRADVGNHDQLFHLAEAGALSRAQ